MSIQMFTQRNFQLVSPLLWEKEPLRYFNSDRRRHVVPSKNAAHRMLVNLIAGQQIASLALYLGVTI
jgi:hypothetical protein